MLTHAQVSPRHDFVYWEKLAWTEPALREEQMVGMVQGMDGKRLRYQDLVG